MRQREGKRGKEEKEVDKEGKWKKGKKSHQCYLICREIFLT